MLQLVHARAGAFHNFFYTHTNSHLLDTHLQNLHARNLKIAYFDSLKLSAIDPLNSIDCTLKSVEANSSKRGIAFNLPPLTNSIRLLLFNE